MRGFFYYTGRREAILKMVYAYADWLEAARDGSDHFTKETPEQVITDFVFALVRLHLSRRYQLR